MKTLVTRKSIKNSYNKVISIGYCNLCYLLKYEHPFAYSTRVEGWACDYYSIDGVVISTGYAPIGDKISFDLQHHYNESARNIVCNLSMSLEEKQAKVNDLLKEFLKEVAK